VAIPDGWFVSFAPSGQYLACGTSRVTIARIAAVNAATGEVTLDSVTELGEGGAPQWYNPGGSPTDVLLYSNKAGSFYTCNTPPPFVPAAFGPSPDWNAYGAGGGYWTGYLATAGGQLTLSTGGTIPGRFSIPGGPCVDQVGRTVYIGTSGQQVLVRTAAGATSVIDAPGVDVINAHIALGGAVWQRFEGPLQITHGWRGAGVERVHVAAGASEYAVVIDTPTGPWILSWSNHLLLLRAWGSSSIVTVPTGGVEPFFPHGVYSSTLGGFVLGWNNGATGALGLRFVAYDAGTGVITPPTGSGGGGPGLPPVPTTGTPASQLTVTPVAKYVPPRHRIYPHVAEVTDKPAQQTIKLLWDRVQELTERIEIGDIAQRFAAVESSVSGTNTRIDEQEDQLESNPAEALATQIPSGGGTPGEPPPPGGGGGGGGTGSGSCADSPGTGHYDPGGPLTNERARKICCGTGDEWSNLRVPTTDLATRESNAEQLTRRVIWHLNQGGFTAGRQQNPSLAISKDKLAIVISGETRAFDIYSDYDAWTNTLRMQWSEVFPAVLVADAGIAD
jgi:hypothetical protein